MRPLTNCDTPSCNAKIFNDHVYKEIVIKDDPQFMAVLFKCPDCRRKNKIVCTWADWQSYKAEALQHNYDHDKIVRAGVIELEYIDTVDDLQRLWASLKNPPFIETLNVCECDYCQRRYFEQEDSNS